MRPHRAWATATVAGLLVAFSMPPWGWWPLAFAGTALFPAATSRLATRRQRAVAGWLFGLAWLLPATAWMWFLTVPGYLVAIALFAGYHAVAAAVAPDGPWGVIGRPAAHTLAEALRLVVPFGGVPLATLGISQAGGPLLAVAEVGGVLVITWMVFQLGEAAVAVLSRTGIGLVAGAAVVWGGIVGVTMSTMPTSAAGPPLRIAAVQGGGEQGTSALEVPASEVFDAHLAATRSIPADAGIDLVIWPENGIDVNREPFVGSAAHRAVAAEAARLGVPFTVGVTLDSEYSAHPVGGRFVNAQVIVTPDGEVTGWYEKVRIVPFGEYVPLRGILTALGAPLDQIPTDAVAGRDPAVITLPDGTTLGVVISWEVFFGGRGRAAGAGEIIINPTNGASYTGTILQTQQIASSRLRAVENGRWVVQVAPTGFSAFIDPEGSVLSRTGISEQRIILGEVTPRSGTTIYRAIGDWPWRIAAAAAFALATLSRARAARSPDRR